MSRYCYCPLEHDWVPAGHCAAICCYMCEGSHREFVEMEDEEESDER